MFPSITRSYIEHCQFSSWHRTFTHISPRAVIIRPLSSDFRRYLEEDGIIVPDGSEDFPVTSSLSDKSSDTENDDAYTAPESCAFPELDAQIRDAISRYGAVFPKLNWTSPRDASWMLPHLKCTSPSDVYLLLKSSDFISHDLDPSLAFEGCSVDAAEEQKHELELVLKKWYPIDRGREFRCFVRDETLLGISQRDPNYYPHLNAETTKGKIVSALTEFWATNIRQNFDGGRDYIFDVHMTRDMCSAHLLDINPYHPKTDSFLFTYEELLELFVSSTQETVPSASQEPPPHLFTPVLRVIASPTDPVVMRNSPANQHNAVPFDLLQMTTGSDIDSFVSRWEQELKKTLDDESDADIES